MINVVSKVKLLDIFYFNQRIFISCNLNYFMPSKIFPGSLLYIAEMIFKMQRFKKIIFCILQIQNIGKERNYIFGIL